jgi:tripartite-type tricarboxylate transporter receptor subunit TctC
MLRKKSKIMLLMVALLVMSMVAGCSSSQPAQTTAQPTTTSGSVETTTEAPKIDFPTKSIEFVVPFAAGGNVDLSARIIGPGMEETLGQKIVIVNKDGGGAVVGQQYAANSKPDGYTMIALTSSYVTNIILKGAEYKIDSLEPIGMFTFDPEIMLVYADSDIQSIDELIEKSKESPLMHSTPGHSTSHHIAGLIFENLTGAKFEYIHTNGSAEQTVQIAGGHAEIGLSTYGGAASLIDQGKIRVLAVAADERLETLPDVPTFKELGYEYNYGAWRGVAVPKGTPQEVKDILEEAFMNAMTSDEVVGNFGNSGFPITLKSAEDFGKYILDDYNNIEAMKDILSQ